MSLAHMCALHQKSLLDKIKKVKNTLPVFIYYLINMVLYLTLTAKVWQAPHSHYLL